MQGFRNLTIFLDLLQVKFAFFVIIFENKFESHISRKLSKFLVELGFLRRKMEVSLVLTSKCLSEKRA